MEGKFPEKQAEWVRKEKDERDRKRQEEKSVNTSDTSAAGETFKT